MYARRPASVGESKKSPLARFVSNLKLPPVACTCVARKRSLSSPHVFVSAVVCARALFAQAVGACLIPKAAVSLSAQVPTAILPAPEASKVRRKSWRDSPAVVETEREENKKQGVCRARRKRMETDASCETARYVTLIHEMRLNVHVRLFASFRLACSLLCSLAWFPVSWFPA